MNIRSPKKIVLLGMMSRWPVAGVAWMTVQYLIGFQRLGCEVYYVEAHAHPPTFFMHRDNDNGSAGAAAYIAGILRRFDLGSHWAFHALHDESDGRCYGMSEGELKATYRSADLIINLHGSTYPLPEHRQTGRLIYLETDPVQVEIELAEGHRPTVEFLEAHAAFFTWGLNYGKPGCRLPVSQRFRFRPSPPPVVLDLWQDDGGPARAFTTVGNWKQSGREVRYQGEVYRWSKHWEFLKFLDVPARTGGEFELALSASSIDDADRRLLESRGWRVRDALAFSGDPDCYRRYLAGSRGEFTVAKDQNIRLRSGWFSERSAQYLAAGRPVITQDTGFGSALPTGGGLFAFATLEDVAAAVEAIDGDYERHRRQARDIARAYLGHDVVLKHLLDHLGL